MSKFTPIRLLLSVPRWCACIPMVILSLGSSQAQISRHNAAFWYESGEKFMNHQQWDSALHALNTCLRLDASFADAYYARGLTRERLALFEEALTDYNIYLEWKPDHPEALFNRAQLRYRLKKYEFARQDLLRLLSLPPGETTTVFFRQNPFSNEVNQVFTTQGSNKAYVFNYLGLVDTQREDFGQAIHWFDSALMITPRDAELLVNRGIAFEKSGDARSAQRDYEAALALNANLAIAKHNLSVLLSKNGKHTTAEQMLNEAIDDNPQLPFAYAERGYHHMSRGDYQKALIDFDHAIQLDSSQQDYFLNRGIVHEKMRHYKAALSDYSRALRINERFEKAWLNRGNLQVTLKNLPEAIEDYTVAITYDPAYGLAYYNRAIAYHRMGRLAEACQDIRKAKDLQIDIPRKVEAALCKEQ